MPSGPVVNIDITRVLSSLYSTTALDFTILPVGSGPSIVDVASAPERQAGEVVEDDGEGYTKIVEFLDKLKVI